MSETPFDASPFTLAGPFARVLARLHLLKTPDEIVRIGRIAAIAWAPLMVGEGLRVVFGGRPSPTALDISVHVRLLIALPLMLASARLVDAACQGAITSLYRGELCDRASLDRIAERAAQLRDAWWAEGALLALALLGGQLALWHVRGVTELTHGFDEEDWSFPYLWYALVALPLVQFVMFRWLWRWLVWSYMLVRIARLPLRLIATHPDHAAGLSPVAWPITAFGGFAFALGSIMSGAWATELLAGRTTLREIIPGILGILVALVVIAFVPLLTYCGHLYRARRLTLFDYTGFALGYTREFHERWIESRRPAVESLGSPDIQSLNDLCSAYQVIGSTRLFVFGPRKIIELGIAVLLPMVPLFASSLTVEHVVKKLVSTILGGLPL